MGTPDVEELRARVEFLSARHLALGRETALHEADFRPRMLAAARRMLAAGDAQRTLWSAYLKTGADQVMAASTADEVAASAARDQAAASYRQAYEQFMAAYRDFDEVLHWALPFAEDQTRRILAVRDEFVARFGDDAYGAPPPQAPAEPCGDEWQPYHEARSRPHHCRTCSVATPRGWRRPAT